MAEGEPSEPPQERKQTGRYLPDVAARRAEMAREQAEDMQRIRKMDLASHIASLEVQARDPHSNSEKIRQEIGVYSFMGKTHKAQTLGDVETALRSGEVDPSVVHLWIDEDMINSPFLENPIAEGYPQFDADLKRVKEKRSEWMQELVGSKEQNQPNFDDKLDLLRRIDNEEEEE